MPYTDRDLELIRANPDIMIVEDERATPLPRAAQGKMSEHDFQAAVVAACAERAKSDPRWACIFAIPNGGARDKATAGKLKAEGVRAGIPDLFCAVPSGQFAGLFIELKVTGGRVRQSQQEWIQRLRRRGYCCKVIWDNVQDVINAINNYLEGA